MAWLNAREVFAGVLGLSAIAAMALVQLHLPPPLNRPLHEEIGRALAKETLGLLQSGSRVTVITRDTESFAQPSLDVGIRSLERELHRNGVARPRLHLLQTDPLRPVDVPSGDFYELLRRIPPGDVIVSLFGPPLLNSAQRSKLPGQHARVVAFCPGRLGEALDLDQLFNAGLLHAAVVSRSPDAIPAQASRFAQLYEVVHPARGERASTRPTQGDANDP